MRRSCWTTTTSLAKARQPLPFNRINNRSLSRPAVPTSSARQKFWYNISLIIHPTDKPRNSTIHSSPFQQNDEGQQRDTWGNPVEFLMSCISLSVGLGNIWRFPFTAVRLSSSSSSKLDFLIYLLSGVIYDAVRKWRRSFFDSVSSRSTSDRQTALLLGDDLGPVLQLRIRQGLGCRTPGQRYGTRKNNKSLIHWTRLLNLYRSRAFKNPDGEIMNGNFYMLHK